MPDYQDIFQNSLAPLLLLMLASTTDPVGRLNNLSQAITSLQNAVKNINTGMDMFHTEVVPMLRKWPE